MNPTLFLKFKAFVLSLILSIAIPTHIFAQITQAPQSSQLTSFKANSQKIEHRLSIGLYTSIPLLVGGLAGLLTSAIARNTQHCAEGASQCFGSNAFLIASAVSAGIGSLLMASTGFPWLAVDQQLQKFQSLPPLVVFECHISSAIAYAPVNITCNRTSSFAQANGASLVGSTEWNFADGRGFQSMNETVQTYPIGSPGDYAIQVQLTDTNNHKGTGTFNLNVPDGSPQVDVSLSYSNPYQSAPTNVTFSSGPVQAVYPCSISTGLSWTLPNEATQVLSPNESYAFTRNYPLVGTYGYSVVATDSSGRVTTKDLTFVVQSPNPIASITISQCYALNYQLDASGSRVNFPTTIASYQWNADDRSIQGLTTYPPLTTVSASANGDGTVTVTLNVTDALGHWSTTSVQLYFIDDGVSGTSCSYE